jgi:hypothetical protein
MRFGNGESNRCIASRGRDRRQSCELLGRQLPIFDQCEVDDMLTPEPGNQFLGCAERDHLTAIDDRDAIAQTFRFVHVVRCQQDGSAARAKAMNDVPQLPPRLRIETRRWFIEDNSSGSPTIAHATARHALSSRQLPQ